MLAVASFRNLNLGHRGSPSRTQLIAAFGGAGVAGAAVAARDVLAPLCGYADAVVVRRAAWLLALADELPAVPPTTERVLGVRATSRAATTMLCLAARLATRDSGLPARRS